MLVTADLAQKSQHSTWIEVRLDHLLSNLKVLKQHAGPRSQVMTVVKANAYGHGLLEIAKALSPHVAYLGVASLAEALSLRERQISAPVFLFGRVFGADLPAVLTEGVTLSVSSFDEAQEISEISQSVSRKTPVHVKVDTGMGRLGIQYDKAFAQIERMAALPAINLEGIYTHFPSAESEDGFREEQVRLFAALLQELEMKGITFRFRHAANSAGTLKVHSPVFNLVRPGIMLYGLLSDPVLAETVSVSPVLSLKSRIISVKQIREGDSVGYGRNYVAASPTHIAILPIGYSHGYPFSLSNRSWVLYKGVRYPIAGRVSMDYLAVDLGKTEARIGDEVFLIGGEGPQAIRAEELAHWGATIPYEIVTRLAPNLPRFYR